MKKLLLSLGLIVGFTSVIRSMENAIHQSNWEAVTLLLGNSQPDQFKRQLDILVNSKISLNSFAQDHSSLLGTLLHNAVDQWNDNELQKKQRSNFRIALKELIRHDKLDPELQWSGKFVVNSLDEQQQLQPGARPFLQVLQAICNQVYEERRATASIFHTYESSLSPLGFARCRVKWTPLCLLVDSRAWAFVGVAVVASAIYKICTDKSEQSDDVEQEEDLQPQE